MPVYQITYRSGAQQFMEMDDDEANLLTAAMDEYKRWEDKGDISVGGVTVREDAPDRVFASNLGATLDVSEIAGFQHYITPGYAVWRSTEEGADAILMDAMQAAIHAMYNSAEIEDGAIVSINGGNVMQAFFEALGREA